jgi:hypothetical protein
MPMAPAQLMLHVITQLSQRYVSTCREAPLSSLRTCLPPLFGSCDRSMNINGQVTQSINLVLPISGADGRMAMAQASQVCPHPASPSRLGHNDACRGGQIHAGIS